MSYSTLRACTLVFLLCCAAAAQGVKITYAGGDWIFPGDGLARNAPLGQLWGITLDPRDGNPVVVDHSNCIIAKIRPDATLSVIAGNGFCGNLLPSGDGGPATNAVIFSPFSAIYDAAGNLYVSTFFQVRKITPDGTVSLYAGTNTFDSGFSGDGGPANRARIDSNGGLATDRAGNLYLADGSNNVVRRIGPDGTIRTIAGNGIASYTGDGGPAPSASLDSPSGLAIHPGGDLFIADSGNGCVRRVDSKGAISTVVSDVYAWSLAFDAAGTLYIGGDATVYKLAPGAITPVVIAGSNEIGFAGDGGPASAALLQGNVSVTVGPEGIIYLADDNGRVRRIGLNGIITTIAGNGNFRYAEEGAPALIATLNDPWGVALDSAGNVFFSEPSGHRIRKASRGSDGVVRITTVAGNGLPGLSADPGPASQSEVSFPLGTVTDAAGSLYFADGRNDRVRKIDPRGNISTYALITQPVGLALDRAGNLYVSSGDSRVRRVDLSGRIQVIAGTGGQGTSGDGGPATSAQLETPTGLAVDDAGNLFIADEYAFRVRKVSPSGIIATYAGTGLDESSGDGGPATSAGLLCPTGLAVDAAGNLYISEYYSGSVRKVDRGGTISTFAIGPPIDRKGDGQAVQDNAPSPSQLAFDRAGNLFITDGFFHSVREVLATPPAMQVSPITLVLPTVASGGATLTRSITVTGSIAGLTAGESIVGLPFHVSIQSTGPVDWLTADTKADVTPRLLTLTADPAALPPGQYTATVTIATSSALPAVLKATVSLTVGPAQSPQLTLDQPTLSYTLTRDAALRSNPIQIANSGGQTLNYTASPSTASGGNWLSISAAGGHATPGKPSTLTVIANPKGLAAGTYTGAVEIDAGAAGTQSVTVIMTVSENAQAVLLTQTGLSFTAVEQGGVIPPQAFGVINAGAGIMKWTAGTSVTSGANWLRISPQQGASDTAGVVPQVTVSVSHAGLAAGKYYGTVRVDAPGTANLSRVLTVFLSVLPAGTAVAASVQPTELVFHASSDGGAPGSQNVEVYNIAAKSRTFTAARSAGGFELLTLPASGSLSPDKPTRVAVQPNAIFVEGPETGSLRFQFSDGTVQTVKITVIAEGARTPNSPAVHSLARAAAADTTCTPSQLIVSLNSLSQAFQVSAGWPVGLSVNAIDDCRNPLAAGSVWAHFDNGEDDVPLTALGDGTWQGTWRPQKVNPTVTMTINARGGNLPPAERVVSGAQSAANDRPYFTLNSIANVFATPAPEVRPLAPGSFLSVYGARLSDYAADAGGALLPQLANTQVWFNDQPAPLHHADSGQINVVVPKGVNLNTSAQIRVQRGDTLSEPVAVDIAASHTSILQIAGNAWALDTPASGGAPFTVGAAGPATAGDTLTIYCTGLGATTPPVADGAVSPASPLAEVRGVTASIGGKNATVSFAGLVPGFVGLYQVNLVVPSGVPAGSAALTVTSGGQTSPEVNLAVR